MAVLKANSRTESGTRVARKLRASGMVPAIIYGHGEENLSIALNQHDLDVALHHGDRLMEIDLEGTSHNVLIKDVQYDTFGIEILHADLTRVNLDERVEVTVSIVLRGTPKGASDEGVLQQSASDVSIECVVTAIPDEIRVSVIELGVGDSLTAADLELPEGATLLTEPDTQICSVHVVAEAAEAAEEEGEETVQPEVIGEKPEEDKDSEASE